MSGARVRVGMKRPPLSELHAWVVQTVLLFGGSEVTAYLCAADFVHALQSNWDAWDRHQQSQEPA